MKRAGSSRITQDVQKSSQRAVDSIWKEIRSLKDKVDTNPSGARKIDESGPQMRLVKDGNGYYIEAKFDDGWARIPSPMQLITKRD